MLHTHEEAGAMGVLLSRRFGIPHVYDMHSSLPEQFENFARFNWPPVTAAFRGLERYILNGSDGVIAICEELKTTALRRGYDGVVAMIENTLQFEQGENENRSGTDLRRSLDLSDSPTIVYTGTLEPYQGMELLVDSAPAVLEAMPSAKFVVVGGTAAQVEELRRYAERIGVASAFRMVGMVKPWEVRHYHEIADALVTCRTRGTNTPLKLYHYLQAGRPIVATAIRSHTQVLDDTTAELVELDPASIARGLVRVLTDRERAIALSDASRSTSRARYNEATGVELLARFLDDLQLPGSGNGGRSDRTGLKTGRTRAWKRRIYDVRNGAAGLVGPVSGLNQ
jgi:glycosyltransferase involved in cell wall biosynthesis